MQLNLLKPIIPACPAILFNYLLFYFLGLYLYQISPHILDENYKPMKQMGVLLITSGLATGVIMLTLNTTGLDEFISSKNCILLSMAFLLSSILTIKFANRKRAAVITGKRYSLNFSSAVLLMILTVYLAAVSLQVYGEYSKFHKKYETGVERYPGGEIRTEWQREDNNPNGYLKGYAEDGTLMVDQHFKHGKQDGLWKRYYKNGKLNEEADWKNGKQHGIFRKYDDTGQLRREIHYKDGVRDGIDISYFSNGNKDGEQTYANGVRIEWRGYHENGKLRFEYFYKNGKKIRTKTYDEEGNLKNDRIDK